MRHPTEGVLRRLIDEPAGVSEPDRQHVRDCQVCLVGLAAAREGAAVIGAALRNDSASDVDVGAAWRRLSAAAPAREVGREPTRSGRFRGFVRRPAVAALAFGVVLTGAGVAAANDWLPIFQTERVDPVEVTSSELVQLPDLSAYGDIEITQQAEPQPVASAEVAREQTGLAVPEVSQLPEGVTGDPTYQAAGVVSAVFTFSADKAARAAAAEGQVLPPPPPGIDGSALRLEAGPGVAAMWSQPTGVPTLVVARVVAPKVYSSGVPFATVRDYLLSLPGLPDGLATQLRDLSQDAATLPLPVPAELVTTSTADVGGSPATVLTSRNGLFAGVVWVEDGVMTGVAGSLSADELLSVARDLR